MSLLQINILQTTTMNETEEKKLAQLNLCQWHILNHSYCCCCARNIFIQSIDTQFVFVCDINLVKCGESSNEKKISVIFFSCVDKHFGFQFDTHKTQVFWQKRLVQRKTILLLLIYVLCPKKDPFWIQTHTHARVLNSKKMIQIRVCVWQWLYTHRTG